MAQRNKVVHIFVHPLFYKKLESAKQNYSKKYNLSKDISFNKFTEYLGRNNKFNLKDDMSRINTNLKNKRGFYGTKKRAR